jgi:hypothetical protein
MGMREGGGCAHEWIGGANLNDRPSQYPTRKIPRVTSAEGAAQSDGPRRIDSSSATLPSGYAIPRRLVERADIEWFAPLTARVLALVDGTRTIQQIADEIPMALGEAQGDVPRAVEFGWRCTCDYAALLEPSTALGSSCAS